jgi:hypothetical protein
VRQVLERLQRLLADGVGGRQPQYQRVFGVQQLVGGDGDGVGRHQGLAAAGRQAQADVRQAGQLLDMLVHQALPVFGLGHGGKGQAGAVVLFAGPEVVAERLQCALLVLFERQHVSLPSLHRGSGGRRPPGAAELARRAGSQPHR